MEAPMGILVRSEPYDRRGGRERLDPALAAATLDIPLKVFFVGDGILHLVPQQQPESLPASFYTKAWAALLDLSDNVQLYAESSAVQRISGWSDGLLADVQVLDKESIARKLNGCRAVIHV